jgi:hypothetical protein
MNAFEYSPRYRLESGFDVLTGPGFSRIVPSYAFHLIHDDNQAIYPYVK